MKDMIDESDLEVIKDADTIVLTFPVPEDTRFISWSKFNQYMINCIYQIEQSLDILNTKEIPYTIEHSGSSRYTAYDVSELRVGNDVIYNNSNGNRITASMKELAFNYIIKRMNYPTGKVVIILSDNGNEYKFYTSEDKYYHIKPSV